MSRVPPDVAEVTAQRERRAWRLFSRDALEADQLERKFKLRRFAGPASFVGRMNPLRIAHLTDQHIGRVTPMAVQQAAVKLTNAESPDLVLLTGDFVCHSQAYLDALEEVMRGLSAPAYAVLGNHDHWSGAAEVRGALRRAGVEILDNANTRVEVRGSPLTLVGLDDAYTSHADRARALAGVDPRVPTIGLSHIAEEAAGLWAGGVELVLSGHTHAGQVTLAGLHELAIGRVAGHKYIHGLYGTRAHTPGQGAVYVGAGIGAAVMPLRLGERGQREIAIFDLGVLPSSFPEPHQEQDARPGRQPSPRKVAKRARAVLTKQRRRDARARNGGD